MPEQSIDKTAERIDRVLIEGGATHIPAELREAAQKANRAGLEGFALTGTDYGMLLRHGKLVRPPLRADEPFPGVYFTIEYRREPGMIQAASAALHLCDSLLAVREGATDELIREVRHALAEVLKRAG